MQFSSIIQTNKQFLLRINVELTYTKYSLRKITRTVYTLNVCQPKTPNRTHSVNLPLLAQMTGRLCNPQHGLSQHIAQRLEVQWLCIRGEPQTSRLLARTTRSTYSHAFACASAKVMNLRPTRKALVPEPHRTKKKQPQSRTSKCAGRKAYALRTSTHMHAPAGRRLMLSIR